MSNYDSKLAEEINLYKLYRPDEVATIFQCSTKTIYGWMQRELLECVVGPRGRIKRVPGWAIQQILEKGSITAIP